ncbi:thymidylate synthase, flavin-dependent [Orientia tsutsugamushi str. Gilliam]|uniref:Flavin-dependent thymidylate synthase n=2 Tax=Orientia tsutsugamushi TaxID=784 RepID=A0A0F3M834_ORITS|nr:FAD-dependent thymidylate synthase [Orientia tsutsugamushi]KJV51642.1 thymidylate synthase, flavin-dependent [Orientia tsutsugamushi str. Gilliam]SPM46298.1 thymidylate synthase (FAD) [Orientia tsutsugamushi]SPR09915.1 thymidylate synthase (FAD) [Orientia tsutsugamushi]SPR12001.1 thymidylate synthase (FAD) [Orientia tsutsugamushi str. Gilliam]
MELKKSTTKRSSVNALEEILYNEIKVLDHGFIRVVDYMGDDFSVVQAARVSYGRGTKQLSQDRGLIRYLMRHRHTTPFEMCDIKFHIKLPIFVARQWIRHRTASINEYSARYSILAKEFYLPRNEDITPQSKTNKQGRSEEVISEQWSMRVLEILKSDAERCYQHYEEMLNEDSEGHIVNSENVGIARELARINLPLNYYTEWYWKVNLHNLLHFLSLRGSKHAQYEIRAYAKKMIDIVKLWVPYSFEAFEDYVLHSALISKGGLAVVRKMIKGEKVSMEDSNLSKREWEELMEIVNGDS